MSPRVGRLPLYHDRARKNMEPHHVSRWSVNDLMLYLRRQDWCNPVLLARFAAQRIDGSALCELTEQELRQDFLTSSKRDVDRILASIRELASQPAPTRDDTPPPSAVRAAKEVAGVGDAEDSVAAEDGVEAVSESRDTHVQDAAAAEREEEEIYFMEDAYRRRLEKLAERASENADRERRRLVRRREELTASGAGTPEQLAQLDADIEAALAEASLAASPPAAQQMEEQPPQEPAPPSPPKTEPEAAQPDPASATTPPKGAIQQDSSMFLPGDVTLPWPEFVALQADRAAAAAAALGSGMVDQDAAVPADVSTTQNFASWVSCGMPSCLAHLLPPQGHVGRSDVKLDGGDAEGRNLRRRYKLAAKRREWARRHGVWASEKKARLWRPGLLEEARRHSELTNLASDWDSSEHPEGERSGTVVFWSALLTLQTFFYWTDAERDALAAEAEVRVDSRGGIKTADLVAFVMTLVAKLPPAEFDHLLKFAKTFVVDHTEALQEQGRRRRSFCHIFHRWDSDRSGQLSVDELQPVFMRLNAAPVAEGRRKAELLMSQGDADGDGGISADEFCEWMASRTEHLDRREVDSMMFRLMRCIELQQATESATGRGPALLLQGQDVAAAVELLSPSSPVVVFLGEAADPAAGVEQLAQALGQVLELVPVRNAADIEAAAKLIFQRGIGRGVWMLVSVEPRLPTSDRDALLRRLALCIDGVERWRMHRHFVLFIHVSCEHVSDLPPLLARRAVTVAHDDPRTRAMREKRGILPKPEPGSKQWGSTRGRFIIRVSLSAAEKLWR